MDSSLTFLEEFFCFSEEQRKGKEKEKGLVYYTLPQMKLCSLTFIFASMRFLTTLGACIKTQASVVTVRYMEGREITYQVYKTSMILL